MHRCAGVGLDHAWYACNQGVKRLPFGQAFVVRHDLLYSVAYGQAVHGVREFLFRCGEFDRRRHHFGG
uniref:Uncharacterized protein n=1 Tax=uncultured marine virus TaxID=186617 RepID=A0A0F7L2Z1_9VIRU|nr:hypothetical protein [uncultured marine virus]